MINRPSDPRREHFFLIDVAELVLKQASRRSLRGHPVRRGQEQPSRIVHGLPGADGAVETPAWETGHTVTPYHPLRAKGVGESATVGAPARDRECGGGCGGAPRGYTHGDPEQAGSGVGGVAGKEGSGVRGPMGRRDVTSRDAARYPASCQLPRTAGIRQGISDVAQDHRRTTRQAFQKWLSSWSLRLVGAAWTFTTGHLLGAAMSATDIVPKAFVDAKSVTDYSVNRS